MFDALQSLAGEEFLAFFDAVGVIYVMHGKHKKTSSCDRHTRQLATPYLIRAYATTFRAA